MSKPIEQHEFDEWAKGHLALYASTSVDGRRKGVRDRLIFGAYVAGGFKVTRGYDTLYEGPDFIEAQAAYNDCLEKFGG